MTRRAWFLIVLGVLSLIALANMGCALWQRDPICDALVVQVEKATTSDQIEKIDAIYKRHRC